MRSLSSCVLLLWLCGCSPSDFGVVKPPPSPVVSSSGWLIVVEEQSERTADTARLLNDTKFWNGLQGWERQVLDDDDPAEDAQSYVKLVRSKEVAQPALVVVGKDGTVNRVVPLPKSKEGVLKLLGM